MITAKDLNFKFCNSLSASKAHAIIHVDVNHNVVRETVTTGRTIGGMFKPKEQKIYYYRPKLRSKIHESIDSLLEELNS